MIQLANPDWADWPRHTMDWLLASGAVALIIDIIIEVLRALLRRRKGSA